MARTFDAKGNPVLMELDEDDLENLATNVNVNIHPKGKKVLMELDEDDLENLAAKGTNGPRKPHPKGSKVLMELDEDDLEDLASFNNYSNAKGAVTNVTGTHAFTNVNNAKGGNFNFKDHKKG